MLKINSIQKLNETTFKNKTTSTKLAAQKLARLNEAPLAKKTPSEIIIQTVELTKAQSYLSKEAAKVTSQKLAEQKAERLAKFLK